MTVSIVIVNYNTRELLRRCLLSIQAHAGIAVEVIVVDNASQDGSAAMAREVMPDAIVIEPGRNTWFSGGNNLGFQRATGDYSYILNSDTQLQPGTLPALVDYLAAHPAVGAVTCRMEYPDGGLQATCSQFPTFVDRLLDYTLLGVLFSGWRRQRRRAMWYEGWLRDSTRPVEVAPGSNILCRTALIRQIDGFDESLRLYFTDDDLCQRLRQTGHDIHFVGGVRLIHEEQGSGKQTSPFIRRVYFDDLLTFTRKVDGRAKALLLRLLLIPTRLALALRSRQTG